MTTSGPVGLAVQIGVFVGLLVLSGLFSGSEVALFSLSSGDLEAMEEEGGKANDRVVRLLARPRRLLVAILLLNTVVNVGAAILSAQLTLAAADALGVPEAVLLVVQVVVLTFVLLVTSEIAPKLVASRRPQWFARRVSPLLLPLVRLVTPVADALAGLATVIQSRFRPMGDPLSSEDIKTMAELGEQQGSLEEDERALIHSIVEFGETTVREVMVSRVDVQALPETASLEEALDLIRETGHSRFPLYRDHLDHVLGVVYAKDLLPSLGQANGHAPDWALLARQPRFVPASKPLDDMLADFQTTSTHLAIVVDEYGGTAGLVTLEDLLEEVVGEIRDELDDADEETLIRPFPQAGPDTWAADARVDLDDLAETVGLEMETETFDFETLGGLILHVTGEVPSPGDEIEYERLQLRVEGVEENRIREVRVTVAPPPLPEDEHDEE
ncbi:MAG: hemolysin family protein [Bacteroidota bacterium]